MKRNLIAAAALLGMGASAMAQSSVSIYGLMDIGVVHGSGSLASTNQVASGNAGSSRFGFRGAEDLGGGLSAGFNLEAAILADDGEGGPTSTNNQASGAGAAVNGRQGITFGRRATVSLYAPMGELRIGRDYSSQYRNRVEIDPFGSAGVGAIQPFVGGLGGITSTRVSNMLGYYLTPEQLGGFYGQAQIYLGENPSGTPDSKSGSGKNIRLGYAKGDVNVAVSTAKTNYLSTATAGDVVSTSAMLIYKIGSFRLMTGYFRDTVDRTVGKQEGKGWSFGGTYVTGPTTLKAIVSTYGQNVGTQPETDKLSLGVEYAMSKRTMFYADYGRVRNKGGATTAIFSTTAPNQSSSGVDLGMRHTF